MASSFSLYKLIVLYMLDNIDGALTNSQISEFVLEGEYTNYFHLQQALSELVESGLATKQQATSSSYYRITQDGREILSCLEEDISPEIRKEVREFLKEKGCAIQQHFLMPADYFSSPQGDYTVRLRLIEKNTSIIDLALAAPNAEAAKAMCKSWPDKCQEIYGILMEQLL